MRVALVVGVALVALGCANNPALRMTPAQCRQYVTLAKLGVGQCDKLDDPGKVEDCRHYATIGLEVAKAACGFIPEPEVELSWDDYPR
jgi:hypothetical protein